MDVLLTPELERLILAKVESGLYPSASDVVREAMSLLEERDRLLDELRRDIRVGLDQADRGELLDGPETFARLRARLVGPDGRGG